jgi:hypothetical protein
MRSSCGFFSQESIHAVVPLTSPYVLFTASAKDEKKAMGKAEGDQFEFSLEEMVRCATRAAIAPTTYIWHREWRT